METDGASVEEVYSNLFQTSELLAETRVKNYRDIDTKNMLRNSALFSVQAKSTVAMTMLAVSIAV